MAVYSDAFTNTDNTSLPTHNSNWVATTTAVPVIKNNTAVGQTSGEHGGARWNQAVNSAHYSKVVIATSTDAVAGPAVRCQTGTGNYYYALRDNSDNKVYAGQLVGGVATDWDAGYAGTSAGDTIELSIDPSTTTTVYLKVNGTTVTTFTSKNALSGGYAGVSFYHNTGTRGAESWEGGDVPTGAYSLTAAQGSYSLTGQSAGTFFNRAVAAAQGSYSLTGQAATLSYTLTRTIIADSGLYTLVGSDALVDVSMNADQGSYSLTGQSATLTYQGLNNYSMPAAQGSYALTGQSVTLLFAAKMPAAFGQYNLSGFSNILRWSAAPSGRFQNKLSVNALKIGL